MLNPNNMRGYKLVTLANTLSIFISENFSVTEIDILGNFFSSLGSNLNTIAAAQIQDILTED